MEEIRQIERPVVVKLRAAGFNVKVAPVELRGFVLVGSEAGRSTHCGVPATLDVARASIRHRSADRSVLACNIRLRKAATASIDASTFTASPRISIPNNFLARNRNYRRSLLHGQRSTGAATIHSSDKHYQVDRSLVGGPAVGAAPTPVRVYPQGDHFMRNLAIVALGAALAGCASSSAEISAA